VTLERSIHGWISPDDTDLGNATMASADIEGKCIEVWGLLAQFKVDQEKYEGSKEGSISVWAGPISASFSTDGTVSLGIQGTLPNGLGGGIEGSKSEPGGADWSTEHDGGGDFYIMSLVSANGHRWTNGGPFAKGSSDGSFSQTKENSLLRANSLTRTNATYLAANPGGSANTFHSSWTGPFFGGKD